MLMPAHSNICINDSTAPGTILVWQIRQKEIK